MIEHAFKTSNSNIYFENVFYSRNLAIGRKILMNNYIVHSFENNLPSDIFSIYHSKMIMLIIVNFNEIYLHTHMFSNNGTKIENHRSHFI